MSDSVIRDIEYKKYTTKNTNTKENNESSPMYSLKQSSFNPMKGSPNLFMTKLMLRLQNYAKEEDLNNDPLSI